MHQADPYRKPFRLASHSEWPMHPSKGTSISSIQNKNSNTITAFILILRNAYSDFLNVKKQAIKA